MNNDPVPDSSDPSESEVQTNTRWWNHHHCFFVLAVLSRYKVKIYKHKKVHHGKIGDGLESWKPEDESLAIEEGRRQLQRQFNELQYTTTRASVLLTIATAAAIYFLTELDDLGGIAQPWQWIARVLLLVASHLRCNSGVGVGSFSKLPTHEGDLRPCAWVASRQRCNSGVGVGSFDEQPTHEGDLRPCLHEYRPQKLSAPRSTSCSARAATSLRSSRR